jgi:hypothetical protein
MHPVDELKDAVGDTSNVSPTLLFVVSAIANNTIKATCASQDRDRASQTCQTESCQPDNACQLPLQTLHHRRMFT